MQWAITDSNTKVKHHQQPVRISSAAEPALFHSAQENDLASRHVIYIYIFILKKNKKQVG